MDTTDALSIQHVLPPKESHIDRCRNGHHRLLSQVYYHALALQTTGRLEALLSITEKDDAKDVALLSAFRQHHFPRPTDEESNQALYLLGYSAEAMVRRIIEDCLSATQDAVRTSLITAKKDTTLTFPLNHKRHLRMEFVNAYNVAIRDHRYRRKNSTKLKKMNFIAEFDGLLHSEGGEQDIVRLIDVTRSKRKFDAKIQSSTAQRAFRLLRTSLQANDLPLVYQLHVIIDSCSQRAWSILNLFDDEGELAGHALFLPLIEEANRAASQIQHYLGHPRAQSR